MRGLTCPICNTDTHIRKYEKDYLYVCATCNKILGYFCKGCDEMYLENRLAFYNNAYICKECGRVQWGYTEWKQDIIRAKDF